MPISEETEHLAKLDIPELAPRYSLFERIIGHIIFEGHGARIALELTACVLAHALLQALVPWKQLGFDPQWGSLYAWFFCCALIILFDVFVLCRSAHVFRRAYLLGLQGEYEKALHMLEEVGPRSKRLVRLPQRLYHLYRAELAAHQGKATEVDTALELAEATGVERDRLLFQKLQLTRVIGEVEHCHTLISSIAEELGERAELFVEKARTYSMSRDQWSQVKQAARQAKKFPDAAHSSGERCHRLASAYEAVAMLWTGEAEEGLKQLDQEIEQIRRSMLYVDSLRPIFSHLLLERSIYLATHKEPTLAVYDYTLSRALCAQEELDSISSLIREELHDRYAITLGA